MRGFVFKAPVDPHNPLDPSDLPPKGWGTGIYGWWDSKAIFGFRSSLSAACCKWENREKKRYEDSESIAYVFRFRREFNNFTKLLGQYGYVDPYVRFFRYNTRAEIWTGKIFGFRTLIALVRVRGKGRPSYATILSPKSLPEPAKEFLIKALSGLTVRFELCTIEQLRAWYLF